MKDSILNSVLIAFTFSAILFAAFDDSRVTLQTPIAQASRVVTIAKTVVVAKRLSTDVASIATDAILVASTTR